MNIRIFRDRKAALINSTVMLVTACGWLGSFALMAAGNVFLNIIGVLLCAQTMVWAAYLIHEAAHQALFAGPRLNLVAGETANFIAGSSYASFERIRQMHIRHHVERADHVSFDFREFIVRRPVLRRFLEVMEWAYVPATEALMHLQVVWRPLLVKSQRRDLPRAMSVLVVRLALLALLGLWSLKALLLYFVAYGVLMHVLNFFDCFQHTFESFVVAPGSAPPPRIHHDRAYEQANTYSDLVSVRWPWLNALALNFPYHNAHHHRASLPWYQLPSLHRSMFPDGCANVLPARVLLGSWHRNRVRRVTAADYGAPAPGKPIDDFVGAHGVSFLTVI